jgi:hypothetical protein
VVEERRATLEAISRNEGKPEQALPKIVEGRLNGLVQGPGAARAALRQGRQADHRQAARSTPRIVRFEQVVDRPGSAMTSASPGNIRPAPLARVVLKLSGEAFAGPAASASTAVVRTRSPPRSSTSVRTSASTSPWWSVAATSGGA